jgi:hypothetical protein
MTLMLLAALAAPAGLAAQAPNLSGTWQLQVDKSDFGMMPGPTSRTDVIDHKDPSLTIKRSLVGPQGPSSTDLVYAVDGKEWKNKAGDGSELVSTLKWDGAVLVVVTNITTPQGEAVITDRFSLSSDGRTLTQERVIAIQGQEIAQKMVLAKQ